MKVATVQELELLVKAVPERAPFGQRDCELLRLLAHTGLRVGELVGLDVEDVAILERRVVRDRCVLPAAICKGGRSRTVPLNRGARLAIAGLLQFKELRGFALAGPLLVGRMISGCRLVRCSG